MTEGKHENPGQVDRYQDLNSGPPEHEPVCYHCVTSLGILQGASKVCAVCPYLLLISSIKTFKDFACSFITRIRVTGKWQVMYFFCFTSVLGVDLLHNRGRFSDVWPSTSPPPLCRSVSYIKTGWHNMACATTALLYNMAHRCRSVDMVSFKISKPQDIRHKWVPQTATKPDAIISAWLTLAEP